MRTLDFSIILPIYNQGDHVEALVKEYNKLLKQYDGEMEILWIVNGSRDDSYRKLNDLTKGDKRHRVYNMVKGGWGRAVKFGLKKARGKWLLYTNSARTRLENLQLILSYARVNEMTVIKASRIIRGESTFRKMGSILYNLLMRLLLRVPVWDVNGTPKVLPRRVYEKIKIRRQDDVIDAEILMECFRKGARIIEVPIMTGERVGGQSTTKLSSAIKMYKGIWELYKGK